MYIPVVHFLLLIVEKGDVQEKEATREVEIETNGQAGRKRKKQRLRGIADNLSHQVLQAHQATQGAGVMREEDPEVMKGVKEANVQEAVVQKEGSGQLTKMEMLNNLSQGRISLQFEVYTVHVVKYTTGCVIKSDLLFFFVFNSKVSISILDIPVIHICFSLSFSEINRKMILTVE